MKRGVDGGILLHFSESQARRHGNCLQRQRYPLEKVLRSKYGRNNCRYRVIRTRKTLLNAVLR